MKKIILGMAICTFLAGTITAQQDSSRTRRDKSKDRNMNHDDRKKKDSGSRDMNNGNNRNGRNSNNSNNGNNGNGGNSDYGRDRNNMRTDSTRR